MSQLSAIWGHRLVVAGGLTWCLGLMGCMGMVGGLLGGGGLMGQRTQVAQSVPRPPPDLLGTPYCEQSFHGLLEYLDTNRDGVISAQEFALYLYQRFMAMDANSDGIVTWEEFQTAEERDPLLQRMKHNALERLFRRLDGNEKGHFTQEEFITSGAQRFRKVDADGDRTLTEEEFFTPPVSRPGR